MSHDVKNCKLSNLLPNKTLSIYGMVFLHKHGSYYIIFVMFTEPVQTTDSDTILSSAAVSESLFSNHCYQLNHEEPSLHMSSCLC